MSQNTPEHVVSEETGRASIDAILEGIRDTQIRAGVPVPGGRAAEDFARQVTAETVKRHEERMARPAPSSVADAEDPDHPCRINRGDVGDETEVVSRDLENSARGRKHLRGETRPLEILLLEGRLELLRYFPCEPNCTGPATDAGHVHPWADRLMRAVDDTAILTRRNGWTDDDPRTTERICESMLKVVELSGAPIAMGGLGLGDYRELRREVYVRLPRRGGLVPLSQLPKHAVTVGGIVVPPGVDTSTPTVGVKP